MTILAPTFRASATGAQPFRAGAPATLRVAAVIDAPSISGPGRQLAALASELRPHGVEFLVILFRRRGRPVPAYASLLERSGVRHIILDDRGPLDLGLLRRLSRVLEEFGPDVVQSHIYRATALCAGLRSFGARWPWIAFFHGATTENLKTRCYHAIDRRLMRRANRVVLMSAAEHRRYADLGPAARVLHNAVLPSAPRNTGSGITLDSARPRIGVVGRLSPEKGVDVFLDACGLLAGRGTTFSATIAGDGPERERLAQRCLALRLDDRIRFVGSVDPIEPLYDQLDLLVIPSRSEGLPNVLLEALRADLPVVATRVGAVPEVIGSSAAGMIVAPGSPDEMAGAIEASLLTLDDPDRRDARRDVAARFSIGHRGQAHLVLYREVIAERGG